VEGQGEILAEQITASGDFVLDVHAIADEQNDMFCLLGIRVGETAYRNGSHKGCGEYLTDNESQ
jgi:hypothetical protein